MNETTKPEGKVAWQKIVASYSQPDLSRSLWQIINTLIPFFVLFYLTMRSVDISFCLTLPLALLTGGFVVRAFIIFHDCGHGSFFKSQRANDMVGIVTGLLAFTPYYRWKHEHAIHHATSGDLDRRGVGDIYTMTLQEYLDAPWSPEDAVREMKALDVPVIGANCSQGPQPMLETLRRLAAAAKRAKLAAMPNAGAPAFVDGRYVYLCTPEYMATYAGRFIDAGAAVVGGCCGTTPEHIKSLVGWVRMRQPTAREPVEVRAPVRPKVAPEPLPREAKSPLARKLGKKLVVSVEIDPPKGADARTVLERAQHCHENEIDVINVADGPRASARMSAQSVCLLLEHKVGIDTILHYTCRDRNLLGIQSDLLGAHALGLRNILASHG